MQSRLPIEVATETSVDAIRNIVRVLISLQTDAAQKSTADAPQRALWRS